MKAQQAQYSKKALFSDNKSFFIKSNRIKADLILLLAATVWGSAFVPQRMIANHLGVFIFNGIRFILGGLVLLPLAKFRLHIEKKLVFPVALAGFLLYIASAFQQAGLKTTSAGNAGFITGLYVVMVPLFVSLSGKARLHNSSWLAALISIAGLFFLSVDKNLSINPGDALELAGASFWALHIIVVSLMVKRVDVLTFSILQFFVCGVLNLATGLIFEYPTFTQIINTGWAILYTGIVSVGIGYTLQAIGQKNSPPTDAAIILSMEAVFAAIFGYLLIGETMNLQKVIGCLMIFSAIILSQLVDHTKTDQTS